MKVWVVLPAFDEAENLPALLPGLAGTLNGAALPYKIVVVDDGSQDGTRSLAEAFRDRFPVEVVSHERNRGLARTVETGIRHTLAQAEADDVLITMDADNTHPPQLIPSMLTAIRRGADLVIASRYAPGGMEEGVPLTRQILSLGIGVLLRLRFGLRGVRDYSSGYRAYRAQLLRQGLARYRDSLIEAPGFSVMAELLVKLQPFHPRIAEVPLHLRYDRKRGQSKMRLRQTVREYLSLLFSTRRWVR